MSLLHDAVRQDPFAELSRFRGEFYSCLTRRADALFELADAVLCADGPVRSLVELSLVGEHRRGHGGLYDALAARSGRCRPAAAGRWPRCRCRGRRTAGWCWPRTSPAGCGPSAHTSPQRILCHTYGRGKDQHIPVPGWPYSVICALETGRSSWTAPLDALRLAPGRRRRHRHRRADARTRRAADRCRAVEGRRPGHPDRGGRRLRRATAGLPAEGSAGAGAGPDALGPCPAPRGPAPRCPAPGAARPATAASSSSATPTTWDTPTRRP